MQKFTRIPTSQTLQSSLPLLLDNDTTAISQNSGTAFPTTNLVVGMPCVRTDQNKTYTLKSISAEGVAEWVETANLAATMWNSANDGAGSGMDADTVDGLQASTTATAGQLLALDANKKLPASITGDAASVGGLKPGVTAGAIPINNGTRNANLNADMLDGIHAGNSSGAIPINNGVVNADLNADMLDGFHAASFVRSISGVAPDANGNVAVNVDMSGRVSKGGDTMTGALTAPGFTATDGSITVSGTSANLRMADTSSGTTRTVHHDNNVMGFLKTDGSWDMYANNAGQIWTPTYGWLHDKFYSSFANCGNTERSKSGKGNATPAREIRLYQGSNGQLLLGNHAVYSNCNCNCSTDGN